VSGTIRRPMRRSDLSGKAQQRAAYLLWKASPLS